MTRPQAKAVLWSIRRRIREDFEDFPSIKLEHCYLADKDHREETRVHAHTLHKRNTICVASEFWDLPEDNVRGILWHECGHLILELYEPEDSSDAWDWMTEDEEMNADLVCEHLFGIRILYDERKIQVVMEEESQAAEVP